MTEGTKKAGIKMDKRNGSAEYGRIRALARALSALLAILFCVPFCSCGTDGQLLCTVSSGGREYAAYGSIRGITGVKVTENGDPVAMIRTGKRSDGEPYSDGDGLNYGLTVTDVDLDGYDDVVIQTCRESGNETYRFFFGDGKKYTAGTKFDSFAGAVFGLGDGLVGYTYEKTVWYVRSESNPDVYEHSRTTEWWTRTAEGQIIPSRGESLVYYSDQDIYCLALLTYDPETKQLVPDSERWLSSEELAGLGLTPFEPITD